MILAFKTQFVLPIRAGKKIHTLREDKKDRWKVGKTIHFATGVRTKNYKEIRKGIVVSTQKVTMSYKHNNIILIFVDGRELLPLEKSEFIFNDGFVNETEFFDWFYPLIKSTEENYLKLKLIHWTNHKY